MPSLCNISILTAITLATFSVASAPVTDGSSPWDVGEIETKAVDDWIPNRPPSLGEILHMPMIDLQMAYYTDKPIDETIQIATNIFVKILPPIKALARNSTREILALHEYHLSRGAMNTDVFACLKGAFLMFDKALEVKNVTSDLHTHVVILSNVLDQFLDIIYIDLKKVKLFEIVDIRIIGERNSYDFSRYLEVDNRRKTLKIKNLNI